MTDRLLTDEERLAKVMEWHSAHGGELIDINSDQEVISQAQDAKTLKAVGEWLALSAGYVRKIEIDQLKQGKMPGGE